eukprot:COSAG02_NODE_138_length_34440_cov_16.694368_9_plen_81_part_00
MTVNLTDVAGGPVLIFLEPSNVAFSRASETSRTKIPGLISFSRSSCRDPNPGFGSLQSCASTFSAVCLSVPVLSTLASRK